VSAPNVSNPAAQSPQSALPITPTAAMLLFDPGGNIPTVQTRPGNSFGLPLTLFQSAVPVGIAPTGSVAANGALTLGTATVLTYGPSGAAPGIWWYLPAGAAFAGSPAGAYWCVMTSTTLGTIYNNVLAVPGPLTPPATPTPISAAGPGAYTGLTTVQNLIGVVVPGNSMGPNGAIFQRFVYSATNSAGIKSFAQSFGGTTLAGSQLATTLTSQLLTQMHNRSVTNQQVTVVSGTAIAGSNIDSTVNQNLLYTCTLAAATDWVVIEGGFAQLMPG
jgi:hypothetical protein